MTILTEKELLLELRDLLNKLLRIDKSHKTRDSANIDKIGEEITRLRQIEKSGGKANWQLAFRLSDKNTENQKVYQRRRKRYLRRIKRKELKLKRLFNFKL